MANYTLRWLDKVCVHFAELMRLYLRLRGGVVVSDRTFDGTVGRSEGRWSEASLVSALPCCFLSQETLLHIVSLHPGV